MRDVLFKINTLMAISGFTESGKKPETARFIRSYHGYFVIYIFVVHEMCLTE